MAKIALRVYTREIEELIDSGQIKEAVAHARHILETFPKYVDAYRLLGKAYLEEQLFGDAADIFQRVLSSRPDDFISHVGMSIIREDEGNLDAALWHMERAFEMQPSNNAIQDELRRLYGRRDGMQPPKVRLTRGALARMYAHGELYDQAIAELRNALEKDSQRPDLQVLLAVMYYRAGKITEAAEACTLILDKLPYCIEANHLIAGIYRESDREKEAQSHLQRVGALDPYLARTTSSMPLAENVPDKTVTVDHLQWEPGMGMDSDDQPEWASSLGLSLQEESNGGEGVPDWLSVSAENDDQAEVSSEANNGDDTLGDTLGSSEEEMPEWMRAESSEDTDVGSENSDPAGEEIPEWMQIAPNGKDVKAETPEPVDEEIPEWMQSAPNGEDVKAKTPEPVDEEIPEWMQSSSDGEDVKAETPEPIDEEIPEWMQSSSDGEDVKTETPELVSEGVPESAQVSTSNNIVEPDDSSASEEKTAESVTGSKDEEISSAIEPEPETEEVSDPTGSSEPEAKLESVIPDTPEEDVPDWMSEPESKDSASQPVSESSDDDLPEFLQEAGWQEGSGEDQEPESILSEEDENSSSSAEEELEIAPADIPDWMQDMQPEALQDAAESPPSIKEDNLDLITSLDSTPSAASGQDDAPEWLQGFSDSFLQSDDSTESDVDDVTPEWLNDLSDDTQKLLSADEDEKGSGVLDSLELQEPIEVEPVSSDDTPESDSEDDSMSWLEGLAAKQGAAEEELITQPSDRLEDTPERVGESEQAGDKEQPSPIDSTKKEDVFVDDESPQTAADSEDDAMSWLEGLAAKQGAAEDELLTKPEERTEDAPDWLPESNQTNKEQSPALDMLDDGDVEEKLSWLDSGGEEESRADSPAQDEQPDQIENMEEKLSWLDDLGDSDVGIESPAQDKIGDSTEWMQSLIEEEVGSTDTVESPDDAPEWLQSISAENLETADQSTAPSSEKDVPEWLPELSVDPSDESAPEDAPPAQEEEKEPAWPDGFSNLPDDQSEDPLAFLKENDPFVIEETTVPDNELVQDDKVESLQPEDDPPESPVPDPPKPRKIPTKKKKSLSDEDYRLKLTTARDSVNAGNLEEAMAGFGELIKRRKYLDDIIADLQAALIKHPIDVSTWQTLGDAYMRADRLQDALDSYSKAEDLLR